jgi:L-threonylcarbamoyladenylate synthase
VDLIPELDVLAGSERLAEVVAVLDAGGVVGLPTDTVYGLAARLDRPSGIDRLFELKDRPAGMPVAVLVSSEEQAWSCGRAGPEVRELVRRYWPGALTVVVEALGDVADRVGSDDGSIGLRCPDHELVRALAAAVGPLATTSANRHGHPTPHTAAEVAACFPDVIVIDGGPLEGRPSTVVDARGSRLLLLRAGDVDVGLGGS